MNERAAIIKGSRYEMLKKIGKSLTSSYELNDILSLIMEYIGDIFRPLNWSLLMVDKQKGDLYFSIAVGEASDKLTDVRIEVGQGIAGWCVKYGETVIIPDTSKDNRFMHNFDKNTGFKTEAIIAVPLISKDKVLGVIELINVHDSCFEPEHIDMLKSLCDFAAIAIENARFITQIRELSIRDDCTHLYNSRHMIDLLDAEISRAHRDNTTFGLVFFDLDHFKYVNDNYGHIIGSQLLRNIADIVTSHIRPTDWAIRYGGDEFVIILPKTDKNSALIVANRIRDNMNKQKFFVEKGLNIKIVASFGVAIYDTPDLSREDIIARADTAMYEAKETGRNRIVFFDGQTKEDH